MSTDRAKEIADKNRMYSLIREEAQRFFKLAAADFVENPSSNNWISLEKAMWAVQAVMPHGIPEVMIEQIVFAHPLPQWITQLATQHKGEPL